MMKKRLLALAMTVALSLGMMILPASAADYSIKQLEGGHNNAFVVTNDGTLYAAGLNENGVLGPDVGEKRDGVYVATTLQKIAEGVREVAACEEHVIQYYYKIPDQGNHVLVLMENGDLYAMGDNTYAQLGQNDQEKYDGLQFVMSDVVAMDAGGYFSACVTEDGELYWWGFLVQQLGGNEVANTFDPEYVGDGFVDVSAGVCTLTALKEDGTVWTMGSSAHGARGDGTESHLTREPAQVFSGAVEIASGENHTLVRTANGDVYGWGENASQQLLPLQYSDDPEIYDSEGYIISAPELLNHEYTTPTYIMGGAKAIDASHDNSYVLKQNGDLYTMGTNYYGQFGVDVGDSVPGVLHTASNVKQVSGGYRATYILKEDGKTYAAGNNYYSSFGTGSRLVSEEVWTPAFFTAVPVHEPGSMSFTDVKTSDWFYTPVQWAVDNGITSGTGDGTTFSPDMKCSRAQIITFLWAAGGKTPSMGLNWFTDVKPGWYYNALCWAQEYPRGSEPIAPAPFGSKFYPDDPCTRAMAVEFIWRAMGSPAYDTSDLPFTDVKPTDSYAQAVAWALDNGVTSGTSATTFGPNVTCTRSQIATFLYQAFN